MAQVTRRTIRFPWPTGIPQYVWRHHANIAAHNVTRQLPTRRATQVLRTGTEFPSGHVWTAPWQELSSVAAALVGWGHVSGLLMRRGWPLALMLCADQVPIVNTHSK